MSPPVAPGIAKVLAGMHERFSSVHPFFSLLDYQTTLVARGEVAAELTAHPDFTDVVDGGGGAAMHPGFFTIVLDSMFGMATFLSLDEMQPIATINLKVDTQGSVAPGARVTCQARCEGIADDVAVVRGHVKGQDGGLIAVGAGTFMVGTRSAQVGRADQASRI